MWNYIPQYKNTILFVWSKCTVWTIYSVGICENCDANAVYFVRRVTQDHTWYDRIWKLPSKKWKEPMAMILVDWLLYGNRCMDLHRITGMYFKNVFPGIVDIVTVREPFLIKLPQALCLIIIWWTGGSPRSKATIQESKPGSSSLLLMIDKHVE